MLFFSPAGIMVGCHAREKINGYLDPWVNSFKIEIEGDSLLVARGSQKKGDGHAFASGCCGVELRYARGVYHHIKYPVDDFHWHRVVLVHLAAVVGQEWRHSTSEHTLGTHRMPDMGRSLGQ